MPGAGAKTELLAVERETRTRRDGGGMASTWSQIGEMWAQATWVRGVESDDRGAVREIAVYRFTVLAAAAEELAVTVKDRIVWNGALYNIRERPRRLPASPEIEIIAETGVGQ